MATDYDASTLAEGAEKNLDWSRVALRQADAYALPDFAAPFDAAMAIDWFAHVPISRRHEFLEGLHARLSPGAIVVICDQTPIPPRSPAPSTRKATISNSANSPDGTQHSVIKNFITSDDATSIFGPYSDQVIYKEFPEQRRVVVSCCLR